MFVIGVSAQCQMGKDTLADRLALKLNEVNGSWKRTAFASNVKRIFCETFGVDLEFVEKWKTNPDIPAGFAMPVRQGLQFIGDGFRKIYPTIWIDMVFRDRTAPIIISDVRYVNELLKVKREGGVNILVGRPDKLNDDPNGSEAEIRPYVEWCINKCNEATARVLTPAAMHPDSLSTAPEHMDKIDCFVLNDGTKDEFLELVDSFVTPFIHSFVFDFPEAALANN